MYAPAVIAANQERLERSLGTALPEGRLQRLPVDQCHAMVRQLEAIWDPATRAPVRQFTPDEQIFVANERLMAPLDYEYWATRYWKIQAAGQRLQPMFPLFESQALILAELAYQQDLRWRQGHPDGLLFNCLKGRQLGASTLIQSLVGHRVTTRGYTKGLIASDVPQNSGSQGIFGMLELGVANLPWWLKPAEKFHTKDQHIVFATGSSVIVESGKSMKGGLSDDGGQKGNLGRSKTYSVVHLTELSTWERPEQIDDGLMPAVPQTPLTFMGRESTAKGRHNWWHQEYTVAGEGLGRCFNIFIPWYAERSKYWLPCPTGWVPADDTLAFARRVEDKGPRYMRRAITLDREQLYWYEARKTEAIRKETLFKFLEEYPAEPEEAFQFSGRSVFSIETMDRLERQARPLIDVWSVKPRAELIQDKELLQQELAAQGQREIAKQGQRHDQAAMRVAQTYDAPIVTEGQEVPL